MKRYFILAPEVAGQLGNDSILDHSQQPFIVKKLHYEFDDWLGDDIVESFPCFICTETLSNDLVKNNLKGFVIQSCKVTKSDLFFDLNPQDKVLPTFFWLIVNGKMGDDLSILNGDLLVSEKAFFIMKLHNINHCKIKEYLK